jgi:homoserine kinase type II
MGRGFLLRHERPDTEDVKVIGIYSSDVQARAAIERLRQQPGFCDYPDGFCIDAYELDKDHWTEGFLDL